MNPQDVARELNDPGAQELLHSAVLARPGRNTMVNVERLQRSGAAR